MWLPQLLYLRKAFKKKKLLGSSANISLDSREDNNDTIIVYAIIHTVRCNSEANNECFAIPLRVWNVNFGVVKWLKCFYAENHSNYPKLRVILPLIYILYTNGRLSRDTMFLYSQFFFFFFLSLWYGLSLYIYCICHLYESNYKSCIIVNLRIMSLFFFHLRKLNANNKIKITKHSYR